MFHSNGETTTADFTGGGIPFEPGQNGTATPSGSRGPGDSPNKGEIYLRHRAAGAPRQIILVQNLPADSQRVVDQAIASTTRISAQVAARLYYGCELSQIHRLIGYRALTYTEPMSINGNIMDVAGRISDGDIRVFHRDVTLAPIALPTDADSRRPLVFVGNGNSDLLREASSLIQKTYVPMSWACCLGGDRANDTAEFFLLVGLSRVEVASALGVDIASSDWSEMEDSWVRWNAQTTGP